jgi:hypothetical protein
MPVARSDPRRATIIAAVGLVFSVAMIAVACVRASAASLASLMPPALPRPPTCTCALITTG